MKRFMLSITEGMEKALVRERKTRMLGTIPETARVIFGEYLAKGEGWRHLWFVVLKVCVRTSITTHTKPETPTND